MKKKPVDESRVKEMCDLLRHRGPDDSGVWSDGSVALGHRRLSIIDLSPRGHNPMANEDRTIWITYNGEIYNYRDLRKGLLARGHRFSSDSDTEVILHLFEERGPECVHLLNGIFAFAIWDGNNRRLFLARDRCGVKPLYYTTVDSTFAFASEVKAFLALPAFSARPDPCALAEHFTFQNTFGDRTLFDGVKLLPAGHYLTVEDGRVNTRQYWDLQFEPQPNRTAEQWARGLRERFEDCVTRQLVSDVPLGCYLSGGMDTGSISAVAARHITGMHTFTCGFDLPVDANSLERYFDERSESHRLSHVIGTQHHELRLDSNSMEPVFPMVVWHLDEPRVGISYQVYYTVQLIRKYVTVVLSGVGGDELFAGYPWRYEPIFGLNGGQFEREYYKMWIRFLTDEEKQRLFAPELRRSLAGFSTYDSFRAVMHGARGFDLLHKALYFDFKTFLNGLLIVDDKLSMAYSVEARVPFLDNDFVEYVSRIPSDLKFQNGKSKFILREAMRGLLPDETIDRRKQGFTPPAETWYRGESLQYVRDLILGPRALARGYFEPEYLKKIIDDHVSKKKNNRFLLWSLMSFEWWNRIFVDGEKMDQFKVYNSGALRE